MGHAGAGAHHLHVTRARAALVAHRILVRDRTGANVGDDFHVTMRVRRKAALRRDLVVIPDASAPPAHSARVVIVPEGKMVAGVEPAVVGMAEASEFADIDHDVNLGPSERPSSVSHVTGDGRYLDAGSWLSWRCNPGAREGAARNAAIPAMLTCG